MSKTTFYQQLTAQAQAIVAGETDTIANMANLSALLFEQLSDVNWVGFYRVVDNQLVLGPFQGKVACIRIPFDKGVCGKAARTKSSQRIDNVHDFDGHIACDAASNAELVVPIVVNDQVIAVLDIDSEQYSRFDQQDQQGIEQIAKIFELTFA